MTHTECGRRPAVDADVRRPTTGAAGGSAYTGP